MSAGTVKTKSGWERFQNIDSPDETCNELGISPFEFHRQYIQIRGIYVAGRVAAEAEDVFRSPREFHLRFAHSESNENQVIPAKLPIYPKALTPYELKGNQLFFQDRQVVNDWVLEEVPLPEHEPRYLKGFSFPHLGTSDPYYALRVNPRTSGYCPGMCTFCHRSYSHRLHISDHPVTFPPEYIVENISAKYGADVFSKIRYITMVTELFGSEDKFINYLEKFVGLCRERGYSKNGEIDCCAQDVRSEAGLARLLQIVNPKRYQYTLEFFSNRSKFMSRYKGIPFKQVMELLKRARDIGYDELQLNYIAGIDSFEEFENGLLELHKYNLIDSIGFNVFTVFFEDQLDLRKSDAWHVDYYYRMCQLIKELGINYYKPESFEMGSPFALSPTNFLKID